MKYLSVLVLFAVLPGMARCQEPADREMLLKARTASTIVKVEGLRNDKPSFDSALQHLSTAVDSSKIWPQYVNSGASAPDIIFKFTEDQTVPRSPTILLEVLNPDDQKTIYSEQRGLVEVTNDVHRLVLHFLAEVERIKQEGTEALPAAAQRAKPADHSVSKISCDNVPLYADRAAVRRTIMVLHRGDAVTVTMNAHEEDIVKINDTTGYVDAHCVEESDPSRQENKSSQPELKLPLIVQSIPKNATFFIDGKKMGNTPHQIEVSRGQHKLVIRLDGYQPFEAEIDVKNSMNIVQVQLKTE